MARFTPYMTLSGCRHLCHDRNGVLLRCFVQTIIFQYGKGRLLVPCFLLHAWFVQNVESRSKRSSSAALARCSVIGSIDKAKTKIPNNNYHYLVLTLSVSNSFFCLVLFYWSRIEPITLHLMRAATWLSYWSVWINSLDKLCANHIVCCGNRYMTLLLVSLNQLTWQALPGETWKPPRYLKTLQVAESRFGSFAFPSECFHPAYLWFLVCFQSHLQQNYW